MHRRTAVRLCAGTGGSMMGEPRFPSAGNSSSFISSTGGLPFYGNVYAGRVNAQAFTPPPQRGSGLLKPHHNSWDDPAIQEKIQRCPYFALCDQVIWQHMDPEYLDPGVLTVEEHQLLLLFSRAYFEKWRSLHSRPEVAAPRIRLVYGHTQLLRDMCNFLGISKRTQVILIREYLMDDAGLIGMNPNCWQTASLDPANRDQLSGRVLEYVGLSADDRLKFHLLLRQMRKIVVHRKDTPEPETIVFNFSDAPTLYDLYVKLGLEPYSGQIKTYDLIDEKQTPLTLTINDEDTFFDFLVVSFYKPLLENATLSDVADETDNTCRYSLTVEPVGIREAAMGRWF